MLQRSEALHLLEDALRELEAQKGSVLSAIQKLYRAAELVGNDDVRIWCAIQLGEHKYTSVLEELRIALTNDYQGSGDARQKEIQRVLQELAALGLKHDVHFPQDELTVKASKSGGGYRNIGFVDVG